MAVARSGRRRVLALAIAALAAGSSACFVDFDTSKEDTFSCQSDSDCLAPLICVIEEGQTFGVCGEEPDDPGLDCIDNDGDNYGDNCPSGADCDDTNATVYPGAPEICDGLDNDCDCAGKDTCEVGVDIDEPQTCAEDDDCSDPQAINGMTCVEGTCRFNCGFTVGVCEGKYGFCETTEDGAGGYDGRFRPCAQSGAYGPDFSFDEICDDGLDNDCNNQVDDGPDCNQDACSPDDEPVGCSTNRGICDQGVVDCVDGTRGDCVNPNTREPVIEPGDFEDVCDGIDNDCDGFIDNAPDSDTPGTACPDSCPFGMVLVIIPNGTPGNDRFCIDQYEASRLDATADSPGADDSRAVSRPGVQAWTGLSADQALAACRGPNQSGGQRAPFAVKRLCQLSEIEFACGGGSTGVNPTAYPYGDTYQGDTCNGADAGAGAAGLTDAYPQCVAERGSSQIFNLSGNLAEFALDRSFPRVFGGSYLSDSAGLQCSSDVEGTGQSGPNIGFRCCFVPE